MKKERIFIITFIIIIFLPLIFSDKVGGAVSEKENRYLASFPQLKLHPGLQEEVENWINDNSGGREALRSIYNYFDINVLKTQRDSSNIYMGDWIFYYNESVLSFLQNAEVMSPEEQEDFITSYQELQSSLNEKNIFMGSIIFPQKAEIYAEWFSRYIKPVNEISSLSILEKISIENPDLKLSVPYTYFKERSDCGELLYSKAYDTSHWNNQGAFAGYQKFMEVVQKGFPNIKILSEADMDIREIEREKNYNGKLYRESDLDYMVKMPNAVEDPSWFTSIGYETNDPWCSYRYYKNMDGSLPKILIVGDSYVWMFMMPWLSESFSETVFIHWMDSDNFNSMVDVLQPDVIIFAGLQSGIPSTIRSLSSQININD